MTHLNSKQKWTNLISSFNSACYAPAPFCLSFPLTLYSDQWSKAEEMALAIREFSYDKWFPIKLKEIQSLQSCRVLKDVCKIWKDVIIYSSFCFLLNALVPELMCSCWIGLFFFLIKRNRRKESKIFNPNCFVPQQAVAQIYRFV